MIHDRIRARFWSWKWLLFCTLPVWFCGSRLVDYRETEQITDGTNEKLSFLHPFAIFIYMYKTTYYITLSYRSLLALESPARCPTLFTGTTNRRIGWLRKPSSIRLSIFSKLLDQFQKIIGDPHLKSPRFSARLLLEIYLSLLLPYVLVRKQALGRNSLNS